MRPDWRSIVLTGASGGLGRALAAELTAPERHFLLMGRNVARLAEAESAVRAGGGSAEIAAVDLREAQAADLLQRFDARHPVDLMIANAGVKSGNRGGIEAPGQAARVLAVNLAAPITLVDALLPGMTARGGGQIALVTSLAARSPHGDLLSYSASKAGLAAYATALRRTLDRTGITVTEIVPGFIDTPMTDRQKGPAPLLVSAERAARIIHRGLARNRKVIAFPRLLIALTRLAEALPPALADRLVAGYRAEIVPDEDETG